MASQMLQKDQLHLLVYAHDDEPCDDHPGGVVWVQGIQGLRWEQVGVQVVQSWQVLHKLRKKNL